MCKIIEEMRNDTKIEVYADSVLNLMETLKLSLEQAMDAIKVPEADREQLISEISRNS